MTDKLSALDDDALADRLAAFWRAAEARMVGLPIHNPVLAVMATPVRRFGGFRFAVVTTPWCMNVVAVPDAGLTLPPDGVTMRLDLPAGSVDFVVASISVEDRYGAASLFSPMDEFTDQVGAEEVAFASLDELLNDAEPSEVGPLAVSLDRRSLFGLGRGKTGEVSERA